MQILLNIMILCQFSLKKILIYYIRENVMSSIISNATKMLPDFGQFSEFVLKNQKQISPRVFSQEFGRIQRDFVLAKQRELFCQEADKLATRLVAEENGDFAGIIYSALTKLTEFFPRELEIYAKKGLAVAERNGDYVHMMARLNNLRKVYIDKPDRLYDYIQTLFAQEKCLRKLTRSYESTADTYKTVTRRAASKEDYEKMLAYVQTEIGKLTWKRHPNDAMRKLVNAQRIFAERGDTRSVEYIDLLMSKIKQLPTFDSSV